MKFDGEEQVGLMSAKERMNSAIWKVPLAMWSSPSLANYSQSMFSALTGSWDKD